MFAADVRARTQCSAGRSSSSSSMAEQEAGLVRARRYTRTLTTNTRHNAVGSMHQRKNILFQLAGRFYIIFC